MEKTIATRTPGRTRELGRLLARHLGPGDVVAMIGPLGAGKTQLAKGLAEGLDIDPDEISSPTFTLIHQHDGRLPFYHLDLYRLNEPDQLLDIGADEILWGEGVCAVEWADRFPDQMPEDSIWATFETGSDDERTIRLELSSNGKGAEIARELDDF
jgi:tRNA threonylcarbamoyladenosine biosynthesis protein TsaE